VLDDTILLPATRAIHLIGAIALTGSLVFRGVIAPYRAALVERASWLLALLGGTAWLTVQSDAMAGPETLPALLAAVAEVAADTLFGRTLLATLALLSIGLALARTRLLPLGALAACLAVALHEAAGHALAAAQPLLVATVVLHLLAAAIWLGGLLPLYLSIAGPDPARIARRFSVMAIPAVVVIAATGMAQAAQLIGGLPGFLGTAYGRLATLKLTLFLVLFLLAACNRFIGTAALERRNPDRRAIRRGIAVELLLGALVITAAATMSGLPPGVHEQPLWPLPVQPSLVAFEDPDLAAELNQALAILAAAAGLAAIGFARKRARWPAFVLATICAGVAVPHFDLLLIPASPTSFYQSPTGFAAAGIAQGIPLYAAHCANCHGPLGRGDGPQASADTPPADLTAWHLWDHSDGELYGWITQGIPSPRGGLSMPGFANQLDDDAVWALIDTIHAMNAGASMRNAGAWPHPIPTPDFETPGPDNRPLSPQDRLGQPLRIAFPPSRDIPGMPAIRLDNPPPELRAAFALLAGATPEALAGTSFLVDSAGWLRAWLRTDPTEADLRAAAAQLARPLATAPTTHHHH
jgi:putative copper export protein/mono/diheme cytochrome c family protein